MGCARLRHVVRGSDPARERAPAGALRCGSRARPAFQTESGSATDGQYRLPSQPSPRGFADDLMKGAAFADQTPPQRFGYFLFGRPFCPRRIEREAVSIASKPTPDGPHSEQQSRQEDGGLKRAGRVSGNPLRRNVVNERVLLKPGQRPLPPPLVDHSHWWCPWLLHLRCGS